MDKKAKKEEKRKRKLNKPEDTTPANPS